MDGAAVGKGDCSLPRQRPQQLGRGLQGGDRARGARGGSRQEPRLLLRKGPHVIRGMLGCLGLVLRWRWSSTQGNIHYFYVLFC